jgi:hypothetical protein
MSKDRPVALMDRSPLPARHPDPVLDVVVPFHNEESDLEPSVRRLHAHLRDTFPYAFRITVADECPDISGATSGRRAARSVDRSTSR